MNRFNAERCGSVDKSAALFRLLNKFGCFHGLHPVSHTHATNMFKLKPYDVGPIQVFKTPVTRSCELAVVSSSARTCQLIRQGVKLVSVANHSG